jgi:transcription antitermination protein NusB
MLNRRTLRIKAMQSLFAYKHCKKANYNLALNQLHDAFLPDLNSMVVQDKKLLRAQDKEATTLFRKHFNTKDSNVFEGSIDKINEEVMNSISSYYSMLEKDKRELKEDMLKGVNQLLEQYVWTLSLPIVLAEISATEKAKKGTPPYTNFTNNLIIKALEQNKELESANIKTVYSWDSYEDDLKNWLRNIIKQNEKFDEYLRVENPTYDQDKEIIQFLIKSVLFKNETINDFFEMIDLRWSENKPILKSLLAKTIKPLELDQPFELMELSYNWEEDLEFFKTIYNATLKEEDIYEEMIATKSKNWDIDRIASTDMVMLEMAIQEMIHFPSIPVKVTINEYIEISKRYSTPKSKQFVNGVLDVIAVDLQKSGVVKKSGRGLIDNK